jgi:hypothetical protein
MQDPKSSRGFVHDCGQPNSFLAVDSRYGFIAMVLEGARRPPRGPADQIRVARPYYR